MRNIENARVGRIYVIENETVRGCTWNDVVCGENTGTDDVETWGQQRGQ